MPFWTRIEKLLSPPRGGVFLSEIWKFGLFDLYLPRIVLSPLSGAKDGGLPSSTGVSVFLFLAGAGSGYVRIADCRQQRTTHVARQQCMLLNLK